MAITSRSASKSGMATKRSLYAYRYIAPAMIALGLASIIPLGFTVYLSLTNWDQFHPALVQGFHIVGLANYRHIFQTASVEFAGVLVWTLIFAGVSTVGTFMLGLLLAYLLNNPHMRERNLYRAILILPWALPALIMILAWYGLLQTQGGQLNLLLTSIHFGPVHPGAVPWLDDGTWAKVSILMVNLWLGYPFMMTACLGALQSIPHEVLDAAQVDGAGAWKRFSKITFPLLRAAALPLLISTFAYNLNNFGVVYLLTAGGPQTDLTSNAGSTDILPSYAFNLAASFQRYGLAAAYAVVMFFMISGISLVNFRMSRAFEDVER